MGFRSWARVGLVALSIVTAACGSSSPSPTAPSPAPGPAPAPAGLTADQVTTMEGAFVAAENALTPAALKSLENGSGEDGVFDATAPCATSGTIGLRGPVTPIKEPNGDVTSATFNWTIAFDSCATPNVTVQGPLTTAGTVTADVNVAVHVHFTIDGSNTFTLGGKTGSLSFACTNDLTDDLNTGTANLVAKGNVTVNYPTGQNTTTAPCADFAAGFTPPPIMLVAMTHVPPAR